MLIYLGIMANQLEYILSKIVKYGLYAILLTPLIFWPRALYAFMTPKFILFQVLVEIVFAAWLILKIIDFRNRGIFDFGNQLFFRKNYILLALLGFMAVSFVSAFFGVDFSRSFWGIGARMTGLFAELHFLAWFLVLVSISKSGFRSPTSRSLDVGLRESMPDFDIVKYLNFSFFVALAVAATAFYQNTQWTLVWGSTIFNNPTFVAPYLIFYFFWGLYQTITKLQAPSSKLWQRWFFGVGAAFILFVILLGQVRGAILGLFAGILLLGFFLIFSGLTARRFKIALTVLFILLFTGLFSLWIFKGSQFIQNPNFSTLRRLTQFSLSETTAQTRILEWQTALKGFTDHPILGVGPENFNYIFNAHYNPSFLKFGGGGFSETWFDKSHNAFLEILTETGIIGAIVYVLILAAIALSLYKLWKINEKFLSVFLASAFFSYLVTVFFSFDSFGSWFGLYLMLAFLASHSSNTNNTNKHTNNANENGWIKNLFVTFVLIGLFVLEYFNYGIWRANIADADALRIFSRDPAQGIVLFKKSLNYFTPYKSEYQFDLIASVAGAVEKGIPFPNLEDTINFSLGEADKAVATHPKDAAKYTDMARIYNIFGTMGRDPEIISQAEVFGNKSLALSPQRQETLYYLARTALLKNNAKLAIIWAKQAVLADPDIKQSHWYLGLAYIADNQRQEGIGEIKKALELGYEPQNKNEADFIKNLGL